MAEEHTGTTLQQGIGAVDEVLRTVEAFKAQREVGSPPSLSRQELDALTKKLNTQNKFASAKAHQVGTETRIDSKVNGIRTKVAVPDGVGSIDQTLQNLQNRTKASDILTLSVLSSQAPETFSRKERDEFLRLTEDRQLLERRFSQAISDHPAIRKREREIWSNLNKGEQILARQDWNHKLSVGSGSTNPKSGVDALGEDSIRQAKFVAFVRSMEGHKNAFHQASNTREQQAILKKAEERISSFSKGLPLSGKAEVRKEGLSFIKSLQTKTNDLKSAISRKLNTVPRISITVKRGISQ